MEAVNQTPETNQRRTIFYDGKKLLRGWATFVSRRKRALSELTVIDVVGADPGLTTYLQHLDKGRLVLVEPVSGDTLFAFRWASGYVNGSDIRIQGVLD
jgi:hypothetical protein